MQGREVMCKIKRLNAKYGGDRYLEGAVRYTECFKKLGSKAYRVFTEFRRRNLYEYRSANDF
jgi:hypothetical protein